MHGEPGRKQMAVPPTLQGVGRCRGWCCTALHCTALHCTALHCTALHCTACKLTVHSQASAPCKADMLCPAAPGNPPQSADSALVSCCAQANSSSALCS